MSPMHLSIQESMNAISDVPDLYYSAEVYESNRYFEKNYINLKKRIFFN